MIIFWESRSLFRPGRVKRSMDLRYDAMSWRRPYESLDVIHETHQLMTINKAPLHKAPCRQDVFVLIQSLASCLVTQSRMLQGAEERVRLTQRGSGMHIITTISDISCPDLQVGLRPQKSIFVALTTTINEFVMMMMMMIMYLRAGDYLGCKPARCMLALDTSSPPKFV